MRERELTDTHELTNRKVIKHGAGSSKIGSSRNLFFLKQEIDLIKIIVLHKVFENDIFFLNICFFSSFTLIYYYLNIV